MADDTNQDGEGRVIAVLALTQVRRREGLNRLIHFAADTSLSSEGRALAAGIIARLRARSASRSKQSP
ncbi:hypothetical protein ACFVZW_03835 [Streptomyces sp. NPDC059567]|uniref:hypothetical protein n=1 Tax=Streptomyces sp. NPDC059567 TaxID=3346867 RepID=UPI00367EA771